jgi:hypothetical protein
MEVLYQLSYEGAVIERIGSAAPVAGTPAPGTHERPGSGSWRGQDSNLRRQSHTVYSRAPLTAQEPRRGRSV